MSRMDAIKKEKVYSDRGFEGKTYVDLEALSKMDIASYKAGANENFVAIVPPLEEDSYFGKRVYVHYDIGVDRSAVLCLSKMFDKPCPICEERSRLEKSEGRRGRDDSDIQDEINALRPSVRYLFWIVDMTNDRTKDEGVQLYDAPKRINIEIISLSVNKRTGELLDISSVKDGKTLVFIRKGKAMKDTKYSGFELEDRKPLRKEWLEQVLPWDEVLKEYSYDEIAQECGDFGEEEPTRRSRHPEDEEEPTRRSRHTEEEEPARRGRHTEDEEEEPTRRSRHSEEEEPPKRGRRRVSEKEDEASEPVDESVDDLKERIRKRLDSKKD